MAGNEILQQCLPPEGLKLKEVKAAIEIRHNLPMSLQRLTVPGQEVTDESVLKGQSFEVGLIVDETPLWSWDISGNTCSELLEGQEGSIVYARGRFDYVNVLTQEPLRQGRHFFEVKMHTIGDEQLCGVMQDKSQAGHVHGIRNLLSWSYYCGRRFERNGSIIDGMAALHANGYAVTEFNKPVNGDVIGMIVDADRGALAFMLNGKLQGACEVPKCPLYIFTHLDQQGDHVQLMKLPLDEAPQEALDALHGPFLQDSTGQRFCRRETAKFGQEGSHVNPSKKKELLEVVQFMH
eukprot:gnl/MRDRNA2_/MRDRNA2_90090_c0_seq1.p1 gnl/MRDRNA2_/MRDRNA2_90090_c0~~gnl/MRDRNA2_/MRDRNA2_90090_c0_seq1.p1  ORF type:complete len:338 (-),score=73.93 gnl/MRDRNA2_/MRDRNA2_90090_c0_seq1:107-985(-)